MMADDQDSVDLENSRGQNLLCIDPQTRRRDNNTWRLLLLGLSGFQINRTAKCSSTPVFMSCEFESQIMKTHRNCLQLV